MPVTEVALPTRNTGNGTTAIFDVDGEFDRAEDLRVFVADLADVEEELVLNQDWTADPVARTVTFTAAPADGFRITVFRDTQPDQLLGFRDKRALPARDIEFGLDKLTRLIQDLRGRQDVALRVPFAEYDLGMTLPPLSRRANKVLGFGADGRPLALDNVGGGGGGAYSSVEGAHQLLAGVPRVFVSDRTTSLTLPASPPDETIIEIKTSDAVDTSAPVPLYAGPGDVIADIEEGSNPLIEFTLNVPLFTLIFIYDADSNIWGVTGGDTVSVGGSTTDVTALVDQLDSVEEGLQLLQSDVSDLQQSGGSTPVDNSPTISSVAIDSVVINGQTIAGPGDEFERGTILDSVTVSWSGTAVSGRAIASATINDGNGAQAKTGPGPFSHTFTANQTSAFTLSATVTDDQGDSDSRNRAISFPFGLFIWADTVPSAGNIRSAGGGTPQHLLDNFSIGGLSVTPPGSGVREIYVAYPEAMGDVRIGTNGLPRGFAPLFTAASSEVSVFSDLDGGGATNVNWRVVNLTVDDAITSLELYA